MLPDDTYAGTAELRAARCLQRAGQWDLALEILANLKPAAAIALRAEILVDRHAWQLDPPGEALDAAGTLEQTDRPLAVLLTAQLAYWQTIFEQGGTAIMPDLREGFAEAARDDRIRGWAVFFDSVVCQYLVPGGAQEAAEGFTQTLTMARDSRDLLLESYTLRHQGEMLMTANKEQATGVLHRSLCLRSTLAARPQTAAAQATLAEALGNDPQADDLRRAAACTADELGLTWLQKSLPTAR